MLADLVVATDETLRAAARRLASRLALDRCRQGRPRARGLGRPRLVPADRGGDLDLDASGDALVASLAVGRAPGLADLRAREWGRPELALCLLIDCSGSMTGERLAAAALTAAACALRAPTEHAVLAFAREVTVLRPVRSERPAGAVVEAVLQLRGHGLTALDPALRAAQDQLATSLASRRVTLLLSDCRATDGVDPVPAGRAVEELVVLAPADDGVQAADFARAAGGRWALLPGPDQVPVVIEELLA